MRRPRPLPRRPRPRPLPLPIFGLAFALPFPQPRPRPLLLFCFPLGPNTKRATTMYLFLLSSGLFPICIKYLSTLVILPHLPDRQRGDIRATVLLASTTPCLEIQARWRSLGLSRCKLAIFAWRGWKQFLTDMCHLQSQLKPHR